MECLAPKAKNADLWVLIWEDVRRTPRRNTSGGVEHVKAYRSKKEKQEMTLFERFVAEGKETADELATEQCWMETWRRSGPAQFRREGRRCTRPCSMQLAFTMCCRIGTIVKNLKLQPKEKLTFVDQQWEAAKHRTEWCAATGKYRCTRSGRRIKQMQMPEGPRLMGEEFNHKL